MARIKYRFNTKTLSYEKIDLDWKQRSLRISTFLIASKFIGFIFYVVAAKTIDSPKEKLLKKENSQLKAQYDLLDKRMNQAENVMADIQRRDDDIYRIILEAEPIPEEIRTAGFGGINRYKKLMNLKNSELIIESSRKLDQITKQLYIQSKSYDDVFEMAISKEKMIASIPAIQPVSNKDLRRMASGFGMRMHPIYKRMKMHTGMDFSAERGTEIYATGAGKVVKVESSRRGYGNNVIIDHGYGYKTLYAHMSSFKVKRGQIVTRGQTIGFVGNTGTSVSPHLHYEVLKDGRKVNPVNYYFNDLTPEEYELMIEFSSQQTQSFD
ncbi:MAG: M23 family metallopeptidase [Flavobacteriales bacterium]|nr:M23 family metallopeptidase [Flavobacteriales bacterium]